MVLGLEAATGKSEVWSWVSRRPQGKVRFGPGSAVLEADALPQGHRDGRTEMKVQRNGGSGAARYYPHCDKRGGDAFKGRAGSP